MKKTIRKLVVRSETVRVLRMLDSRDLTRAVGGDDVVMRESGKIDCPAQAVVATAACG